MPEGLLEESSEQSGKTHLFDACSSLWQRLDQELFRAEAVTRSQQNVGAVGDCKGGQHQQVPEQRCMLLP